MSCEASNHILPLQLTGSTTIFIFVTLQAAQYLTYAKRVSPANMRRLLRLTAYGVPVYTLATQSRQFFKQHPLVFWAIVVLLLALLLKLLGWV